MAVKKWLRRCAGPCKDEACQKLSGKSYPLSQEADAKRQAHDGCQCTAELVNPCKGTMGIGDLAIDATSDVGMFGGVDITATVSNTSSSEAKNVVAVVEISAAGDALHTGRYDLGTIPAGGSKTESDSFQIPPTKFKKAKDAAADDDVTTMATVEYDMNGKHQKHQNGCYSKAE